MPTTSANSTTLSPFISVSAFLLLQGRAGVSCPQIKSEILLLGNSVSSGNLLMFAVAEIINIYRKALYLFMEQVDICLA